MILPREDIIVKYRYVITMQDALKSLDKVIEDWTNVKFNKIYSGKLLLLVSPIYYIKNSDDILVQLQIDIEGKKSKIEEIFNRCVEFTRKYKGTYFTYTGKTGFHIYSDYAYLIRDGRKLPIQTLRNKILSKYDIKTIIGDEYVDYISSIRHMPTIRIGMRPDTKRLAFPILSYSFDWFKSKITSKDFKAIMTRNQLKEFIKTKMLINKIVT